MPAHQLRILIPVVAGLIAAGVTFHAVERNTRSVTVLRAADDLPAGKVLTSDHFTPVTMRVDKALIHSAVEAGDRLLAEGGRLRRPVPAGAVVFWADVDVSLRGHQTHLQRPGERTLVVDVRETAFLYTPAPGEIVELTVKHGPSERRHGPFRFLGAKPVGEVKEGKYAALLSGRPEEILAADAWRGAATVERIHPFLAPKP